MHQEEVCTESQRESITVLQTGDLWHGFYLFQHSAQNSLTKIPIATGQWIHLQRFSHALAWEFCCSIPATVPGNHVVNSPCTALKIYLSLSSAYEWASFLGTAKEKKNPLNKLLNFFCWTIVQVAGAKAFTKLARCKCGACFACTTNKLKWGNRTKIQSHPYRLPFPVLEPSPLQYLPFRIPILYFSKESVHCLISKCTGEVIYDSHYYNRLAAPKHVKIATIISPTFPSLAPHRRKRLINPVGVIHALVCFYNLQSEFDIFWKWWCLQTSYSL